GLITILVKIRPVEKTVFRWTDLWGRRMVALRRAVLVGVLFGCIGAVDELIDTKMKKIPIVGLIFGLFGGLITALVGLFGSEAVPDTRSSPNQGTRRSI